MARPKREVPVTKTAVYLTDTDIDNLNEIRTKLFKQERIQAETRSDVISVSLDKFNSLLGVTKAHGIPKG